jgi:hypothetical protein
LQEQSEFVKKNEPDTLKYEINVETKKDGAKEVVMLETCVLYPPQAQEIADTMEV